MTSKISTIELSYLLILIIENEVWHYQISSWIWLGILFHINRISLNWSKDINHNHDGSILLSWKTKRSEIHKFTLILFQIILNTKNKALYVHAETFNLSSYELSVLFNKNIYQLLSSITNNNIASIYIIICFTSSYCEKCSFKPMQKSFKITKIDDSRYHKEKNLYISK